MTSAVKSNPSGLLERKRTALVDTFLLFKYRKSSPESRRHYEEATRNERIARTMRLEGDKVTASDVRGFLQRP
ncbi:MAG TPA: hypothetical protein VI953_04770 [Candidatus Paceibacterota bacterium]